MKETQLPPPPSIVLGLSAGHANLDKASEPAENITSRQDQETAGYAEVDVALEQANQDSQDTVKLQVQVVAKESRQDTVQSEDDKEQLCWEKNGFQILLSRRSKVRQKWENYRYRCQEVQRMVGNSVPTQAQFNSGTRA